MAIQFDMNTDYQAKINEAVARNDMQSAGILEAQRNAKINAMNSNNTNQGGWQVSNKYSQYVPQQAPQVQQPSAPVNNFDREAEMGKMIKWNKQMADSSFQSQKAQLDMMLESQVAQLRMAYEQAVADGEISVRDAERQFTEQKQQIEQQAYLDAERTGLYAQDMGIQNSQQAIGLMQGDQARKNSLVNQNTVERDRRISDIRTRLTQIKTQKNIDLARVNAEHGAGLLGARASADQMMAQNMFGLMSDDYKANREQAFNIQSMQYGDQLQRGQMELGQQFTRENIATNFKNTLQAMNVQQGFDLKKIDVSFQNELTAMAKQHGYATQLEKMRQSGRMAEITAQQKWQLEMLDREAKAEQDRLARELDPNSKEFKLAELQIERRQKDVAAEIMAKNSADAWTEIVLGNPNLPAYGSEGSEKPHNYHTNTKEGLKGWQQPIAEAQGNLLNWLTGYDKKAEAYEKEQEAIRLVNEYFGTTNINPTPWTTDPKMSSFERYLKNGW